MRRLPIYFVVGTGESMRGEPIESVKNGLQMLVAEMRKDPQCLESAYLSVITFDDRAFQLIPLTPLYAFDVPNFTTGGGCALGAAIELLCECRSREVRSSTPERRGDRRPKVFFVTDGYATDDVEQAISRVTSPCRMDIVSCVAGAGANMDLLERISHGCVNNLSEAWCVLKALGDREVYPIC